ncbi:aminotransferase class I/II-fold pyridoxal phosphate-dependent enzyme [Thermoactinospora rubra]|uniref:aminotransferase class I/II-fold pyridoxal phosphate-dependent enzyme n=1 Tax=Thermoactinospora rubra TaxID=1088767 RepID=UPI000A1021DD|nr:aminotransferase class I/II-fold pyridoxal phosphate-dependent enzyme [Thermoactinospora rubra]
MPFQTFELENWQSDYERTVRFNLADSTVDPVTVADLLGEADGLERILSIPLYYPEVNGERSLRRRIAGLYDGVGPDDVLVTVGASEANAAIVDALCEPGDRVVVMEPGYRQVWGLARTKGCDVRGFRLDPGRGWAPDLDQLREAAAGGAKLIYVCNPSNPTGSILTPGEMDEIVRAAEDSGAWLIADEVYRGSERLAPEETPSFVGRSERVIGVGSLSKSYGLSGLRIGWAVSATPRIADLWRRHEYFTIATGRLDNHLAELALSGPVRDRLLHRNRECVRRGYELFSAWVEQQDGRLFFHAPMASALAFVRYDSPLSSVEVGRLFMERAGVLVAPGAFFGCEGWFRINIGMDAAYVAEALEALTPVVRDLPRSA